MILALCILLAGAIIARFMKKKAWWLKVHRSLGITGAIFLIVALFAIVLQITLTEREHFRVVHSWIGFTAFIFVVLTLTLGILQLKIRSVTTRLRSLHRWSGRITLCLIFVNILLGLSMTGFI
jgi:heme A synthase